MSFHIVADSCCELTVDMKKRGNIEIAPLTLEVGGESILDDETFDQKYFLKRVAECPECRTVLRGHTFRTAQRFL